MPRMTYAELLAYQARQYANRCDKAATGATNAKESELHAFIVADCKRRGWPYVHSRMDMPSTTLPGAPDFTVALPNGKTLWVECKRRGEKPTLQQIGFGMMLAGVQHTWVVVRSEEEWMELTKQ